MATRLNLLDDIHVASPCPADWSKMTGDERVRHCNECNLNVFDLSEMTREEATRLVFETEGRVCVRFFRRKDGTVITDDCPRGLTTLQKRLHRWRTAICGLFGSMFATNAGCSDSKWDARNDEKSRSDFPPLLGVISTDEKDHPQRPQHREPDKKKVGRTITSFQGEHRFLSNFWPSEVVFERIIYPTAEHAYQSAKTLDMNERCRMAALPTPSDAKREGRAVPLRADWEQVKFAVMETIVRDKFTRNAGLRKKLLATGDAYLEEGNTWGDRVWGVYEGQGENRLGKILMEIRTELSLR